MGRTYYGSPTGGATTAATMNADTPLTQHFIGGANTPLTVKSATVDSGMVTITWSAVEGGTYSVDASPNQTTWTSKATGQVSTGTSKSSSYVTLAAYGTEYGRVNRAALATYDATGQAAATVAQSSVTSYLAGVLSGIQSWRQSWYGSPSNSGNAADQADPFKTGIQNLAVYAFFGPNQNPATAKLSDLPQAEMSSQSLFFDFIEPANISGIIYEAQSNPTLQGEWQAVADTGSGTRHIFSVPVGDLSKQFLRLKVTTP